MQVFFLGWSELWLRPELLLAFAVRYCHAGVLFGLVRIKKNIVGIGRLPSDIVVQVFFLGW